MKEMLEVYTTGMFFCIAGGAAAFAVAFIVFLRCGIGKHLSRMRAGGRRKEKRTDPGAGFRFERTEHICIVHSEEWIGKR